VSQVCRQDRQHTPKILPFFDPGAHAMHGEGTSQILDGGLTKNPSEREIVALRRRVLKLKVTALGRIALRFSPTKKILRASPLGSRKSLYLRKVSQRCEPIGIVRILSPWFRLKVTVPRLRSTSSHLRNNVSLMRAPVPYRNSRRVRNVRALNS
jgi:hypothetical protein